MLNRNTLILLLLVLILVLAASLITLRMHGTIFMNELQNFGHIPAYGVVAVLLLRLIESIRRINVKPLLGYIAAIFAAGTLGVIVELLQYFGPRDADFTDALKNLLGATIAVLAYALWKRQAKLLKSRSAWVIGLVILAIMVVASSWNIAGWSTAYLIRRSNFPVICDFESTWQLKFLVTQEASLEVVPVSSKWFTAPEEDDNYAGLLKLGLGQYPGLSVTEPYPDWTGYDSLYFEIYSDSELPLRLHLRIDDVHHNHQYNDRYTGGFDIHKGTNKLAVPLADIRRAPVGREFDLARVTKVLFFVTNTEQPLKIWVDNIKLL